ncbi:serine hydrolase [Bacillus spizizenii]|uniref:serine hydrolase domain-containing protein n=1 Tax=Bacillus subtilis group TaxID=653685 RepID=UPI00165AF120|nr:MULTISPECIES: serine hydrolase domain-containing protein [Bacillus subtilis group]MCY9086561.1 beta-lactamase family protein [Bacillus inaquosorum]MEC1599844.1 serine hydrolase [Bacillus spizizenii]MEC1643562.1 serine hydrolase [Bacillus spizizenii]
MKTVEIVSPESVGMNSKGLENVTKNIQKDIDAGITNGAVVLAARKGEICYYEAIGSTDIEENRPAKIDDVFFLMSLSKSITAVSVLKAIDQGKFRLDTRVSEIFPEFGVNGKEYVTVFHLLTHQVNLMNSFYPVPGIDGLLGLTDLEAVAKAAAAVAPISKIGGDFTYNPILTYSVLGYLLVLTDEKKRSFSQIIKDEIFTPLGMTDTSFGRDKSDPRIVPMVFCYGPQKNKKEAVFLNGFDKGEVPGGNAYGTANDMFKFAEMLRLGGSYNGARILSPAMVKFAMNNYTGNKPNVSFTSDFYRLGIELEHIPGNYSLAGGYIRGEGYHGSPTGVLASPHSFAGMGGGTTVMMFDPERELTVVYLGHGHTLGLEHFQRMQKINDLIIGCID